MARTVPVTPPTLRKSPALKGPRMMRKMPAGEIREQAGPGGSYGDTSGGEEGGEGGGFDAEDAEDGDGEGDVEGDGDAGQGVGDEGSVDVAG